MAFIWITIIYIVLIPALLDNVQTHTVLNHNENIIKQLLINELRINSEPSAKLLNTSKHFLNHHIQSKMFNRKDKYILKKFIVPSVKRGKNILEFKFNRTDLIGKHEFSAILNLYIDHKANGLIKVSRNGKIIARITNGEENWVTKNISNDMVKWLKKRRSKNLPKYILKIRGTEISFDNEAYIDIKYYEVVKKRNKRNNECVDSNENCCRRKIILNTADLNWSNYVYSPQTVEFYFCAGICKTQKKLLMKNIGQHIGQHSGGCCVPTRLQELRIMYLNEKKELVVKDIQNIMAEDCTCIGTHGPSYL